MIVQQSAAKVIKVKIAIFTFMDQYGGLANTPNIAMAELSQSRIPLRRV